MCMETLVKADIFFFITSIAVILLSVLVGITLYYAIRAFRKILALCDVVEKNVDKASVEVKEVISRIRESFLFNLLSTKRVHRKKKA